MKKVKGKTDNYPKWVRVCSVLFAATLTTCYLLSSTFAKYTASYYGQDSARTSKFSFDVIGFGTNSNSIQNINLFDTAFDEQVYDKTIDGIRKNIGDDNIKLIAPGMQGSFTVSLSGNAESDSQLIFDFSDEKVLADYLVEPADVFGDNHSLESASTDFLPIVYSVQIDGVTKYYSNFFKLHTAAAYATIADGLEIYGTEQALRANWIQTYGPMAEVFEEMSTEEIENQSNEMHGIDINALLENGFASLSTLDMAKLVYAATADGMAHAILHTYDVESCVVTLPEDNERTTITISGALGDMGNDLATIVSAGTNFSTKNVTINWFWAFDAVPSNISSEWIGQTDEKDTYWANVAASGTDIISRFIIKITAIQLD